MMDLLEIQEVKRLQALNYEMLDSLRSQLSWLLRYCESNNIPLPDLKKLTLLFTKSSTILDSLSDENLQPSESDGDLTAPGSRRC
jgi:hypothetical protein